MKSFILLFIIIIFSLTSAASHIVGGEISLVHQQKDEYLITLNLYFDEAHGHQEAKDRSVAIYVFNKRDDHYRRVIIAPQISSTLLGDENGCSNPFLRTSLITYQQKVNFPALEFNDPSGYYFVWERCCRNEVIKSIIDPDLTGTAFYFETSFPQEDNSTPQFEMLNNLYACTNQFFTTSFKASDADHDSLVYSAVSPLAGHLRGVPLGRGDPAPYDSVHWISPYSSSAQIPGKIPFNVHPQSGQISFISSDSGLFVFAVRCEEFRKGRKIGEVRREFQIYVGKCDSTFPMIIQVLKDSVNILSENDTVSVQINAGKCLPVIIRDPTALYSKKTDSVQLSYYFTQRKDVTLRTYFPNLKVDSVNDQITGSLCIDTKCSGGDIKGGEVFPLTLIVNNHGCPQGNSEPFTFYYKILPVANILPAIFLRNSNTDSVAGMYSSGDTLTVPFNENGCYDLTVSDFSANGQPSSDEISVKIDYTAIQGVAISTDLSRTKVDSLTGTKEGKLCVYSDCKTAGAGDTLVKVSFSASDQACPVGQSIPYFLYFKFVSKNHPPVITYKNDATLKRYVGDTILLVIYGTDPDTSDLIKFQLNGISKDFLQQSVIFQDGKNGDSAKAVFTWTPSCEDLTKEEYSFAFTLQDDATCDQKSDTITVKVHFVNFKEKINTDNINLITPNNDGKNDFFQLSSLPSNPCLIEKFSITVFNRWGQEVFNSSEAGFVWDPQHHADGIYYYLLHINNDQYKSWLQIIR